jgi:transcriptional regulator with XRE-family HTH domain
MQPNQLKRALPSPELGAMLRHWRDLRGTSQLELSGHTGFSQRHISFIESGRSSPSRQTLMVIAQALDVPLGERNSLLLAAGYAPIYSEPAWNAAEMQGVTRALERMLRQHEPFPALVMDRYWNILVANEASPRFFNHFIDMKARTGPRNMLHLMFDPDGMRPYVVDWDEVAPTLIQRIAREAVGHVTDAKTQELIAALLSYPGAKAEWKIPRAMATPPILPVIPLGFIHSSGTLRYFSMVTTVGTPQTVTAQELRIECLFPVDEATEALHLELMSGSRDWDDSSRATPSSD